MATYHLDRAAFREHLLNAEWMVAHMNDRAEAGKSFAEAESPVDPHSKDGSHYVEAFEVESGRDGPPGSSEHDRAYAVLRNTDAAAPYVEFGNGHADGHHVLLRAMDVMK